MDNVIYLANMWYFKLKNWQPHEKRSRSLLGELNLLTFKAIATKVTLQNSSQVETMRIHTQIFYQSNQQLVMH